MTEEWGRQGTMPDSRHAKQAGELTPDTFLSGVGTKHYMPGLWHLELN